MGEEKIRNEKKAKDFAENPDNFVDIRDTLLIIQYIGEGDKRQMAISINPHGIKEAMLVRQYADIEVLSAILKMKRDTQARQAAGGIVTPGRKIVIP